MFKAFTSYRIAGLALAAAVSMPVHAQEAESLTVVRDATTGELRAPTAAEHAALQQKALARTQTLRVAKQPTLQKYHPNGARGVRLTDEFTSSVVAVRKADGTVGHQCVEGHEGEHAAHAATTPAPAAKAALQPVTE